MGEMNAYELSDLAGVVAPDTLESPGAKFLVGIYEDFLDRSRDEELTRDDVTELADSAVPVYTYPMWQTFVDLAAWNEDVSEWGREDLTKLASLALFQIAERLYGALLDEALGE